MATRILVVEDDAMNAKLFHLILTRRAGFEVEVTEDAEHVLANAREGGVDLVIMDVSLSGSRIEGRPVDGLEITRRLKADPATKGIPVLLATAHAMKGSRERFLAESGADDYISKPIVSGEELVRRILALVGKESHVVPPARR
jgi:two-component system cell cycle response regulator DivK